MARNPGPLLEKVTLNLYKGDRDTLKDFYPASGWSLAARKILHKICESLRQRASLEIPPAEIPDFDLTEDHSDQ